MNDFNFLLDEERVLQTEKTIAYKAPQVLIIFLVAVAVISLDTFFLGIGLTMALFKSFRVATICIFLLKLTVDAVFFATWYFLVKEKTDKGKFSTLIVTDKNYIIFWRLGEEKGFIKFKIENTVVKEKGGLLRKIYGVYTVQLSCAESMYKCDFLVENKQKINKFFNADK